MPRGPQGIYFKEMGREQSVFYFLNLNVVRTAFSDSNGHFKNSSEKGDYLLINSGIWVQLEILIKVQSKLLLSNSNGSDWIRLYSSFKKKKAITKWHDERWCSCLKVLFTIDWK